MNSLQVSMSMMSRFEGNVYLLVGGMSGISQGTLTGNCDLRSSFISLGRQEQMISLIIHVHSLGDQLDDLGRNGSLPIS